MSKEMVQHIMSLLQSGVTPVFRLSVRKGKDFRLIRVVGSDAKRFQCVFVDTVKEEEFMMFHESINHGTFILDEAEIVPS